MSESANNGGAKTASENYGISVNVFGRTDVGLVRDHNEDNFIIADLSRENRSIKPEVREHTVGPQGTLFAVCDGMGGAAAGEVASQIAVDTIYEQMVYAEATGVLPLIASYVYHMRGWEGRAGRRWNRIFQ